VRARFFDHAGSPKRLRWRSWTYCLPLHRQRRHPESVFYRGSMAGLHVPLPMLRRHPRGCLAVRRGRCGSLFLHRNGLAPPTPCRSPGAPVLRRCWAAAAHVADGALQPPRHFAAANGHLLCAGRQDQCAVWVYDMRANMTAFGKTRPLTVEDFADFEAAASHRRKDR